jgi:hypothetical protein
MRSNLLAERIYLQSYVFIDAAYAFFLLKRELAHLYIVIIGDIAKKQAENNDYGNAHMQELLVCKIQIDI